MPSFYCDVCEQVKTHDPPHTTGYALLDCEEKACYDCCGEMDRRDMDDTVRRLDGGEKVKAIVLYLTKDDCNDHVATNWPGTFRVPIKTVHSRTVYALGHRIDRTDVWFSHNGREWHGVNLGDNQIVRCKPLKRRK